MAGVIPPIPGRAALRLVKPYHCRSEPWRRYPLATALPVGPFVCQPSADGAHFTETKTVFDGAAQALPWL
ncbi:hypothetical protein GCM10029978_050940 [Actinoallomurus acanthiterrae]